MDDTFERFKEIAVDIICCDSNDVTLQAYLVDDLGADSLDMVELLISVEIEFDICVEDDEAEKVLTVYDAVELINEKLKGE